jgi:Bacterial Ig-like domain
MNKFLLILFSIFFYFFATTQFIGCANMVPPSGGDKDTIAPRLVGALPKDSCINFKGNKIVISFDEYVEVKETQQNVVINPLPKNAPFIDYKLKNITIKLKDTLQDNTTYSINFGNAIKDVNEGNAAKNLTYVFSTAQYIDSNSLKGKVIVANTGKVDSTLIAVLYENINDSAVVKSKPIYWSKIDGKGNFEFNHLPNKKYKLYVLPNDYSKKYDDSTKMFAFYDSIISFSASINLPTLLAFKEFETKPVAVNQNNKEGAEKKDDKKLKYATSLANNKYDILDSVLLLTFNNPIKWIDSNNTILITDTNYKPLPNCTVVLQPNKTSISIKHPFLIDTKYFLIVSNKSVVDTINKQSLAKIDTIKFTTLAEQDYGSISIKLTTKKIAQGNFVLLFYKNNILVERAVFINNKITSKLFKTGDYDLYILEDNNKNDVWDTGNFAKKWQPERVFFLDKKLLVKANWDNEIELDF